METESDADSRGRRTPGSAFWVISALGEGVREVLRTEHGGVEALAVFGSAEEAAMFFESGGFGSGWNVQAKTIPELLSILDGRGEDARWVALDPLPDVIEDKVHEVSLMGREEFVEFLHRRAPVGS